MTEMILVVKIISGKASVASGKKAGGLSHSAVDLGCGAPERLGSKEHLDWFKIYLNMVKIRTVQDYVRTKN